jgi:hypothetical protein
MGVLERDSNAPAGRIDQPVRLHVRKRVSLHAAASAGQFNDALWRSGTPLIFLAIQGSGAGRDASVARTLPGPACA